MLSNTVIRIYFGSLSKHTLSTTVYQKLLNLVVDYDEKFDDYLVKFGPTHVSSLTPVNYSGFRWANPARSDLESSLSGMCFSYW
jgi:hypothetical protein